MSNSTVYSTGTLITSGWLNDVNNFVYNFTFPAGPTLTGPVTVTGNQSISGTLTVGGTQLNGSTGSTAVGYNEGATGAVTRTVQAKLQESVSVLDFGADPSGVLDSTTAIQAAITAATAGSRSVYVPGGTYTVSSVLTVPLNMTGGIIHGDGVNSVIQASVGFSSTNMLVGAATLSLLTLRDLTFSANNVSGITTTINLARTPESSIQHLIQRVRVLGAANNTTILNLDGCEDSTVDCCSLNSNGGRSAIGVTSISWHIPSGNFHIRGSTMFNQVLITCQNGSIMQSTTGPIVSDTGSVGALLLSDVYCYSDQISKVCMTTISTGAFGLVTINGSYFVANGVNTGVFISGNFRFRLEIESTVFDQNTQTGWSIFGSGTIGVNSPCYIITRPAYCASGTVVGTPASSITFVNFGDVTPAGVASRQWDKNEQGQLRQWGSFTITGAANTFLNASPTFPIPMPNATEYARAWVLGFANGAAQITCSASASGTTGLSINVVSSTTVTNAQTILWEAWGS